MMKRLSPTVIPESVHHPRPQHMKHHLLAVGQRLTYLVQDGKYPRRQRTRHRVNGRRQPRAVVPGNHGKRNEISVIAQHQDIPGHKFLQAVIQVRHIQLGKLGTGRSMDACIGYHIVGGVRNNVIFGAGLRRAAPVKPTLV